MKSYLPPFNLDSSYFRIGKPGNSCMWGCGISCRHPSPKTRHVCRTELFTLVYVLAGTGTYVDMQQNVYPLCPGSAFLRLPGIPHSSIYPPEVDWLEAWIILPHMLFDALCAMECLNLSSPVIFPGISESVVTRFRRLLSSMQQDGDSQQVLHLTEAQCLVLELFMAHRKRHIETSSPAWLSLARQNLEKNPESLLSVEAVAEELQLGYESFRKKFRVLMGISPGEYRLRVRMEKARHLLETSKLSVKEIALRMGYASAAVFSRQFHRHFGMKPTAVQAMMRVASPPPHTILM